MSSWSKPTIFFFYLGVRRLILQLQEGTLTKYNYYKHTVLLTCICFSFSSLASLISHTLYHDIVLLTNFEVEPISEGFDFPTFYNKNLLISVLWWTWPAWCQTSKAPNNEESLFVKLAKHLGVVVQDEASSRGLWHGSSMLETHSFQNPEQKQNKTSAPAVLQADWETPP